MKVLLLTAFLLALEASAGLHASQVLPTNSRVTAVLSTNQVSFMDTFSVTYTVPGASQILSVTVDSFDFSETSVRISLTNSSGNMFTVRVETYELSNFILPPVPVTVLTPNGTDSFVTPPLPILQKPVQSGITNLSPIESIYVFHDFLWLLLLILVLLSAGTAVFLINRRRIKPAAIPAETASGINPFEQFREKIQAAEKLCGTPELDKERFVEVSIAVRTLLEKLFCFTALESASSEILSYLKKKASWPLLAASARDTAMEILIHIFKLCDRVKYARHKPSEKDSSSVITEALALAETLSGIFEKKEPLVKEGRDVV